MRTLATIALALVVLIASLVFLAYSACAINGGLNGGSRVPYFGGALVAFAVIVVGVYGVNRINRNKTE